MCQGLLSDPAIGSGVVVESPVALGEKCVEDQIDVMTRECRGIHGSRPRFLGEWLEDDSDSQLLAWLLAQRIERRKNENQG